MSDHGNVGQTMNDGSPWPVNKSIELREFFARFVLAQASICDSRLLDAFASVPREIFAGSGPWSVLTNSGYITTPDDNVAFLYQDTLIALDVSRRLNIGEPSLHARCLDALGCRDGASIIHVGAGAGYYTAILAHLVGPSGHVHAYEIDPDLAGRAKNNLALIPWADLHEQSGLSVEMPLADRIYVNAGITHPSANWLNALKIGGRLLFPLQPVGQRGGMLLIERTECEVEWPCRFVSSAVFIGCVGLQDETTSRDLALAFSTKDTKAVRSIRFGTPPDHTCWCAGDHWWLSSEVTDAKCQDGVSKYLY